MVPLCRHHGRPRDGSVRRYTIRQHRRARREGPLLHCIGGVELRRPIEELCIGHLLLWQRRSPAVARVGSGSLRWWAVRRHPGRRHFGGFAHHGILSELRAGIQVPCTIFEFLQALRARAAHALRGVDDSVDHLPYGQLPGGHAAKLSVHELDAHKRSAASGFGLGRVCGLRRRLTPVVEVRCAKDDRWAALPRRVCLHGRRARPRRGVRRVGHRSYGPHHRLWPVRATKL
mmetsp:Transcript_6648/g.25663  ORF Transcript_6648/g.25663 Transcript_6648/m.25663 type:complete len:231 (+) Transcript_6648:1368-2060(+)